MLKSTYGKNAGGPFVLIKYYSHKNIGKLAPASKQLMHSNTIHIYSNTPIIGIISKNQLSFFAINIDSIELIISTQNFYILEIFYQFI